MVRRFRDSVLYVPADSEMFPNMETASEGGLVVGRLQASAPCLCEAGTFRSVWVWRALHCKAATALHLSVSLFNTRHVLKGSSTQRTQASPGVGSHGRPLLVFGGHAGESETGSANSAGALHHSLQRNSLVVGDCAGQLDSSGQLQCTSPSMSSGMSMYV